MPLSDQIIPRNRAAIRTPAGGLGQQYRPELVAGKSQSDILALKFNLDSNANERWKTTPLSRHLTERCAKPWRGYDKCSV
jgi:hypothetical protein